MKTIKSKKSGKYKYDDFEDLFCEIKKLDNEICKNNKKKKNKKHKNKSVKKSSKKYINFINDSTKISDEYFGITNKQRRNLNKSKIVKKRDLNKIGILDKISDLFNIDTNIDIKISDEAVSSAISCLVGVIATIFLKRK